MAQKGEADTAEGLLSLKDGSTNSAAIEAYYDQWAETYDTTLTEWRYRAPDDAAEILCAHVKAGNRVLDVGCGTGMFAEAMGRRLKCRLDGIDISAASLAKAEEKGRYERLQRHDLQVTPLPVPDNAYDAAACVGVLTYIEDAADLLGDLCRAVRSGGFIVFTQRDDRWVERNFDALLDRLEKRGLWKPLMVSDAKPYLPRNDDFSDAIRVIHVLCQVV